VDTVVSVPLGSALAAVVSSATICRDVEHTPPGAAELRPTYPQQQTIGNGVAVAVGVPDAVTEPDAVMLPVMDAVEETLAVTLAVEETLLVALRVTVAVTELVPDTVAVTELVADTDAELELVALTDAVVEIDGDELIETRVWLADGVIEGEGVLLGVMLAVRELVGVVLGVASTVRVAEEDMPGSSKLALTDADGDGSGDATLHENTAANDSGSTVLYGHGLAGTACVLYTHSPPLRLGAQNAATLAVRFALGEHRELTSGPNEDRLYGSKT